MGAQGFDQVLVGPDLGKAFAAAAENDRYWNGHDAYSGTIGQKSGAFEVGEAKGLSLNRIVRLAYEQVSAGYEQYSGGIGVPWGAKPKPSSMKLPAGMPRLDSRALDAADDKWGDTIPAIRLTGKLATELKAQAGRKGTHDKVWVVFGTAAC